MQFNFFLQVLLSMFHNEDLENAIEPVLQVINSGFYFQCFMKSLLLTIRLLELLAWCEIFLKKHLIS